MYVYIYIYMVFLEVATEGFLEVATEGWPEWDIYMTSHITCVTYLVLHAYCVTSYNIR